MTRRLTTLSAVAASAVLAATVTALPGASVASASSAATSAVGPSVVPVSGCYFNGATTTLTFSGFAPGTGVFAHGRGYGVQGTSDAAGSVVLTGPAPGLVDPPPLATERIALTAGGSGNATFDQPGFEITNVRLTTKPMTRRASSTVRWRATGQASGATVYAHFVKNGSEKQAKKLGTQPDRCGYLKKRTRLVPGPGRWTVQLDTSPTYSPDTPDAVRKKFTAR